MRLIRLVAVLLAAFIGTAPARADGVAGTWEMFSNTVAGYNSLGSLLVLNPDGSYTYNGKRAGHYRVNGSTVLFDGELQAWGGRGEIKTNKIIFDWRDSTGFRTVFEAVRKGATYSAGAPSQAVPAKPSGKGNALIQGLMQGLSAPSLAVPTPQGWQRSEEDGTTILTGTDGSTKVLFVPQQTDTGLKEWMGTQLRPLLSGGDMNVKQGPLERRARPGGGTLLIQAFVVSTKDGQLHMTVVGAESGRSKVMSILMAGSPDVHKSTIEPFIGILKNTRLDGEPLL